MVHDEFASFPPLPAVVKFVLLLGLFIKPMVVSGEGTQSGGAIYRRVVLRNALCTAGIIASYAITRLVVVFSLLHASTESNKVGATSRSDNSFAAE